ncbi:hypothetical protein C7974DRAFT_362378, partial [Boeremia exigua]|uniref:uncharacterized protein n=1 Tax=Boeremia exigua TaxID=749465 RepID=UPI001E8E082F
MDQQSTQPIRKPAEVSTFVCDPCVPSLSSSLQALTTISGHVAGLVSETRAHELCRTCRANVFDAKTIRAIYDQTYGHKTEGVFNESMDVLAFYGNRSYISNLHRKFTYRIGQVDDGVKNGCILCSLLEAQEGQEPSFSSPTSQADHDEQRAVTADQASRSFHFSLNLRPAWEWSTIKIEYPDVPHKSTRVQLRTYPVDSRFAQPGATSTHVPNHGVHSQDVNAANTEARHWTQSISRSI